MNTTIPKYILPLLLVLFLSAWALPSTAAVIIQCPGDVNGDAVPDEYIVNEYGEFLNWRGEVIPNQNNVNQRVRNDLPQGAYIDTPYEGGGYGLYDPNTVCMHLGAGDGFVNMADGHLQYIFSFSNLTGITDRPDTSWDERMDSGMLAATFPAPTITVDEGNEFYLSLTNVGMMMRPDLFDPHTVHWHGFPNASSVFDGVPDASISINMGFTFTYYYNVVEPGTYMYHCHVEATEHMQMGMLGNLYVRPAQNKTGVPAAGVPIARLGGNTDPAAPLGYVYNDGDGSTAYDAEYPIQIGSFDSNFHDEHLAVQPLPFYYMRDDYPMLNGRGYPDTVNPDPLPAPMDGGTPANATMNFPDGHPSQNVSSLITASPGHRVLLRISNLNVTRFYTLATLGVPMKVVGYNARLLRGPSPDGGTTPGNDLYYNTNSVTLGGGESLDAILEIPADATSGSTYFVYTTNLNYLNNGMNDDTGIGGMMTEIRIQ
jgi:FtsP/CotA-like multicopper oxidase with cupredoxin domain